MLMILAMAALNHVRGGHLGGNLLPGHPRLWATAGAIIMATPFFGPLDAAAFGLAFLIWSLIPWGHSIGLGRFAPDRKPEWLEALLVDHIPNPWLRLLVLHLIGLAPAFFLVSMLAPLFALAFVAAYEIGWRIRPSVPTQVAEPLVGALWGLMLVI